MIKNRLPPLQGSNAQAKPVALDGDAGRRSRAENLIQLDPAPNISKFDFHAERTESDIMNAAKQGFRVFGGIGQGVIKLIFAPGMLKEAVERQQAAKLQEKTGDSPSLHETSDRYTEMFNTLNTGIENWSNSWIPEPETKAAKYIAKASDVVGEAIPVAAVSALTGGSSLAAGGGTSILQAMAGNALSHAAGASQAVATELAEGSGDPGKAVMRGATAWASEAIGGATIDKLAGKITSPILRRGVSALGEGAEETVDGMLYSGLTGEKYTLSDAVMDFALGTTAGLALGGLASVGSLDAALHNATKGGQISKTEIIAKVADKAKPSGKLSEFPTPGGSGGKPTGAGGVGTGSEGTQTGSAAPVLHIAPDYSATTAQPGITDHMSPTIGHGAQPSIGGTPSAAAQTLEVGRAEIQGSAVPSTPDTEPWKFPDPEPNTIPFPSQPVPDADPGEPATDPKIIPFPAQPDPEPNTIPFPSPSQPDPETEPTIQPLETPDVDPDPNTIPFPTPVQPEPSVSPDANPETQPDAQPESMPDAQPDAQPESTPDAMPDAQPQTMPELQPQPAPQTQPEVSPAAAPDAQPDAQPGPTPDAVPEIVPQTHPDTQPRADTQTETAPDVQAQESTQAQTSAQLWLAAQSQAAQVQQEEKRERPRGRVSGQIYIGSGASGQVYESNSYSSAFGGLSSY